MARRLAGAPAALFARLVHAALAVAGLALAVLALSPATARAQASIETGYDLFTTGTPETNFIGIEFEGVPLGTFDFGPPVGVKSTGLADTIVERLDVASVASVPDTDTIDIELIALQLRSVDPLDPDGPGPIPADHLYVTLQKDRTLADLPRTPGPPCTGTMTITFDEEDCGVFDSEFTIYVDIRFGSFSGPIVCSPPIDCAVLDAGLVLEASGAPWARIPAPNSIVIPGVNRLLNGVDTSEDFWSGVECNGMPTPCFPHLHANALHCTGFPKCASGTIVDGECVVANCTGTGCDGQDSDCDGAVDECDEDITPPVLTCPPDKIIEWTQPGVDTLPCVTGTATATDDCQGPVTVTYQDQVVPRCGDTYDINRTWTAVDACGNSSQCLQVIRVVDTTPPLIVPPPSVVLDCNDPTDPAATGTATATDTCDPAPVVTFADETITGRCPQEVFIVRTWTATDSCGNAASCEQVLVVQDTTPPVLACPADVTVECDDPKDPPATGVATAVDDCEAAPVVTWCDVVTPGACLHEWTIDRTWTATDACGNASSCLQVVEVVDTTPPVPVAVLVPTVPLPPAAPTSPASPAAPASACSAVSSRAFQVQCSSTDNCDPMPSLAAKLVVTREACVPGLEELAVECGEIVEIRLVAPALASPPCSSSAVSVGEHGVKVLTGQAVVLEVTATDDCGNAATDAYDPAVECAESPAAGLTCPCIVQPPAAPAPASSASSGASPGGS